MDGRNHTFARASCPRESRPVMSRLWLAGLLLAAVAACSPAPDEPAPRHIAAFTAKDTDGQPADLASLRGKVVLLNAWATWCKPCRQEIPFLSALQSREGARGLTVVGVSVDAAADREAVLAAVPRLGLRYTVWLDPEARIESLAGTNAVPASVLIDREGVVRWRHVGVVREGTPGLAEALEGALALR